LFGLKIPMLEMIKLCQRAENSFIGVNCGIMDQFAVGMGKKDSAILLNCRTLEYEYVPLNLKNVSIVIGNTKYKRGLTDSKYNERRAECEKAVEYLNREIKSLDPSIIDFTKRGVMGKLFNPIRAYFEKYEKAENVISGIIDSLDKGKRSLEDDNTTLSIEQHALRDLTKKLNKEIEMAVAMDETISMKLEEAQSQNMDPDKVRFIQDEILFPLRQRTMDMQQMIVVNQQGVIAMEVVQRNNKELLRGVDRAKTVTITALRTAVMVANALYNQKIVLQKIQMLNETTSNMITATSRMLKNQGTEIHRQSADTNISVDVLKNAFSDVMDSLDEISNFRQKALPTMQTAISQFRELAEKGEKAIQDMERGNAASV